MDWDIDIITPPTDYNILMVFMSDENVSSHFLYDPNLDVAWVAIILDEIHCVRLPSNPEILLQPFLSIFSVIGFNEICLHVNLYE